MARKSIQMSNTGDSGDAGASIEDRKAALQALNWQQLRALAKEKGVTAGGKGRAAIEAELLALA